MKPLHRILLPAVNTDRRERVCGKGVELIVMEDVLITDFDYTDTVKTFLEDDNVCVGSRYIRYAGVNAVGKSDIISIRVQQCLPDNDDEDSSDLDSWAVIYSTSANGDTQFTIEDKDFAMEVFNKLMEWRFGITTGDISVKNESIESYPPLTEAEIKDLGDFLNGF